MNRAALIVLPLALAACDRVPQADPLPVGERCGGGLVEDYDARTLCRKGDTIETQRPAAYCDFSYPVVAASGAAFLGSNAGLVTCLYVGELRKVREIGEDQARGLVSDKGLEAQALAAAEAKRTFDEAKRKSDEALERLLKAVETASQNPKFDGGGNTIKVELVGGETAQVWQENDFRLNVSGLEGERVTFVRTNQSSSYNDIGFAVVQRGTGQVVVPVRVGRLDSQNALMGVSLGGDLTFGQALSPEVDAKLREAFQIPLPAALPAEKSATSPGVGLRD
jgi:hypothetical protein